MAYGLTESGFAVPQLTDLLTEIQTTLTSTFGANIDLSSDGPFGQLSGVFAEREYLIWLALQDVYNSAYPATATGISLDYISAINAVTRLAALKSTIASVYLNGTVGTVVPQTTLFSVLNSPSNIFMPTANVTLIDSVNCIQSIHFSAVPDTGLWSININGSNSNSLSWNDSASTIQTAIRLLPFCSGVVVSGSISSNNLVITFSGAFGTGGAQPQPAFTFPTNSLTHTSTPVVISAVMTQAGVASGVTNMIAQSSGPIVANPGTLTVINTPVFGLAGVLNTTQATVGRDVETDNELRLRRGSSLQTAGFGTFGAIQAKLKALPLVENVTILENVTNVTDGNGNPPKSFQCFIQGTQDAQTIGNTIFQTKPAGIQAFGTIPVTVLDSVGNTHSVSYSIPTAINIYINITLTVDSTYPSNGDLLVSEALVTAGNSLGIGKTVIVSPFLISSIVNIPGILDVTLLIGTSPSPTLSNNIPITSTEISVFNTTNVTVSS